MFTPHRYKGLRLSTKLIVTYSLVALIAVVASGAVALPLLQNYQDDRVDEERQRITLEFTEQIDFVRNAISNRQSAFNPFKENLTTNPNAPSNARAWPATPGVETVRQKFRDLAQLRNNLRIVVLVGNNNEVQVDTDPDSAKSLQGLSFSGTKIVDPTPSPNAVRAPAPGFSLTASNGRQYNLFYRIIRGDNAPNLFGIDNKLRPNPYVIAVVVPEVAAPEVWRGLVPIMAVAALVALLVSFVVGLLLARNLSRPLVRLTQATQAVARGDYEHRVAPEGGYELNRLAESFNQMTHDVAEAHRMQRQLIANVSHELKTPLTSIQGFSQAMIDGALRRPEDYARPAEIISQEAARMVRLVNGLLDLSKLESGQAALQRHEMDLAEMLRLSVESFAPRAAAAEIALLADFQPPLMINGDPDRLRQVFNNLIDNALKYTPPGGTIWVRAFRIDNMIQASVRDSGSGIPAVDLPHIFERFYQADKSRRRDLAIEGSGLGLAITKEIVLAHNGKIEATSVEGETTQFVVLLPALVNNTPPTLLPVTSKSFGNSQLVNKK